MDQACSVCGVAVSGANVMYAPDGRIVCTPCFGKQQGPVAVSRPPWLTFAIAGSVVGAVPFAVNMSTSSSTVINGEVTSFIYRDWIAVVCGVVAVMVGAIALAMARREQLRRALAFAAGAGVMLLGALQIARGFGMFAEPGAGTSSTSLSIQRAPEVPEAPKGDPTSPDTCPDAQTCFDLGLALVKSDPASSTKAFERSCSFGASGGCFNAGFDWMGKDVPKAISFFEKGCDAGHAKACNEIGRLAATGEKKDFAVAKTMFEKACDGGDAQGCANLALIYDGGHGVKQDLKKARELYEKGCEGSIYNACFHVAEMRETGKGGPKDKAGAKAAYKEACDGKLEPGCKAFARLK